MTTRIAFIAGALTLAAVLSACYPPGYRHGRVGGPYAGVGLTPAERVERRERRREKAGEIRDDRVERRTDRRDNRSTRLAAFCADNPDHGRCVRARDAGRI